LSKNFKYGEHSSKYPLILINKKQDLIISFYEGDSSTIEDSEKIGFLNIDGTKFEDGKIYISLIKEDKQDSKIRCYLYDKNNNLIIEDYLENID